MAFARKPPPRRGRAALLASGALAAGLLLAGCEKLADLGVNLDMEETANAPIGTPLYLLTDMPTVAPAEDVAPAEAAGAGNAPPAGPDVAAAPAPADTHGLTLRPQPLAVSIMMAAARPAETSVAAAPDVAMDAIGAAGEPATAEEAALLSRIEPAAGQALPIAAAVIEAPVAEAESVADGESIATLLADLFAPLLEPAAGSAMASTPAETTVAATTDVAAIGVIEPEGPAVSIESAAIGFELGPEVTGNDGNLTGLTEAQVEELLGPPLAVRRDDPAESWQYATNDCVLHLFFYEQTGAWRVVHMEARTIAALDAPADSCVKSVLAGRVPPSRTS